MKQLFIEKEDMKHINKIKFSFILFSFVSYLNAIILYSKNNIVDAQNFAISGTLILVVLLICLYVTQKTIKKISHRTPRSLILDDDHIVIIYMNSHKKKLLLSSIKLINIRLLHGKNARYLITIETVNSTQTIYTLSSKIVDEFIEFIESKNIKIEQKDKLLDSLIGE